MAVICHYLPSACDYHPSCRASLLFDSTKWVWTTCPESLHKSGSGRNKKNGRLRVWCRKQYTTTYWWFEKQQMLTFVKRSNQTFFLQNFISQNKTAVHVSVLVSKTV